MNKVFHSADKKIVLAIDASRNRSGGAKAHLVGILSALDPRPLGIGVIHLWSYPQLLNSIPDFPWLIKHSPKYVNGTIFKQLIWQKWFFPKEIKNNKCDILLSTDAGTVCKYSPSIVMSRDMLSFEKKEISRYSFFSRARWRLEALKKFQINSLRNSAGAVFLTNYAATVIQKYTGGLKKIRIIPHGVGNNFSSATIKKRTILEGDINCVYVSNADKYKHQWCVIEAASILKSKGFSIKLKLIGAATGSEKDRVNDAINKFDPGRTFIEVTEMISHSDIPVILGDSDIFIFASSCENMPNTLVEGMAMGLPIVSSNQGPMPEILKDAGLYFDPENVFSISESLEEIIVNNKMRHELSSKAKLLANEYSWRRCAEETWSYVKEIFLLKK